MKPYNLIIAGTGGQGVFGLSNLIYQLCEKASYHCQGSTFKGGAQRRGSIHSVLRIFTQEMDKHQFYSTQIGQGELDLLLSMELWESLRYQAFMNPKTKIYVNEIEIPFYSDRYEEGENINPKLALMDLGLKLYTENYNALSKEEFGHPKMAAYLLLKKVIENGDLPFKIKDLEELIQQNNTTKTKNETH